MSIQTTIQARIDAQQEYDAIDYGLRSIKVSGNPYGASGVHAAQIVRACQAATRVTGRFVSQDWQKRRDLLAAKKVAGDHLKAIKAFQAAEFGTVRQQRLELAA